MNKQNQNPQTHKQKTMSKPQTQAKKLHVVFCNHKKMTSYFIFKIHKCK